MIMNILRNEKYCGDSILQKTVTVDCISKTRKANHGEAPMYLVENSHPEDALRMLRAYRFAAQLGFSLDAQTQAAIRRCAPLCASLSRERVREEAEKIGRAHV